MRPPFFPEYWACRTLVCLCAAICSRRSKRTHRFGKAQSRCGYSLVFAWCPHGNQNVSHSSLWREVGTALENITPPFAKPWVCIRVASKAPATHALAHKLLRGQPNFAYIFCAGWYFPPVNQLLGSVALRQHMYVLLTNDQTRCTHLLHAKARAFESLRAVSILAPCPALQPLT